MLRMIIVLARFVVDTYEYVYSLELNVTAGIRPAHTHTLTQLIAGSLFHITCTRPAEKSDFGASIREDERLSVR